MIGIDLGWHSIRLVALQRRYRSWRLQTCQRQILTPAMRQSLALTCKNLLEQIPARVRGPQPSVAMALPMSDIRFQSRPLTEEAGAEDIEFIATMELEQRSIQDGPQLMDYRVVNKDLMLLSCPRLCQDRFEALAADSGCSVQALGIDVFQILDCYVGGTNGVPVDVMLVDVGASAVRVTVFRSGMPAYWRSHPRGPDSGSAAPVLARALQHYRMTEMATDLSRLLVYGGGAADVDVQQTLGLFCGTCSNRPIVPELVDPFLHWGVQSPDGVAGSGYALAFALAAQVLP